MRKSLIVSELVLKRAFRKCWKIFESIGTGQSIDIVFRLLDPRTILSDENKSVICQSFATGPIADIWFRRLYVKTVLMSDV